MEFNCLGRQAYLPTTEERWILYLQVAYLQVQILPTHEEVEGLITSTLDEF